MPSTTGMSTGENWHGIDPFREPDGRWTRAVKLHCDGARTGLLDDTQTREALRYLRAKQRATTPAAAALVRERWPLLWAAEELHDRGGAVRDEVQARLLCQSVDVVAAKTGIDAAIITTYSAYFWDVLDRLKAFDWLCNFVLHSRERVGMAVTEGLVWKYVAVAVGAPALDDVIDDHLGRPEPWLSNRRETAEKLRFFVWDLTVPISAAGHAQATEEYRRKFGDPSCGDPAMKACIRFFEREAKRKRPRARKNPGTRPPRERTVPANAQPGTKTLERVDTNKEKPHGRDKTRGESRAQGELELTAA